MKYLNYLLLAALLAVKVYGQIPGTTRVFGPVAPSVTNSSWGGATSQYFIGGWQEWFPATGDWTNRNYLPLGRMRVGMVASSADDTLHYYVLTSLSPETWTQYSFTADSSGKLNNNGGTGTNMTFVGATTIGDTTLGPVINRPGGVGVSQAAVWSASNYLTNALLGTAYLGDDITTAGKSLLTSADAAAQRTAIGLGALATKGDADYGAITVSGSGATWSLDNGTVGIAQLSATGSPSSANFLRGDNTWAAAATAVITNASSLTVNLVSDMLGLSAAQLTNGPVTIMTKGRTTAGIGRGTFNYDSTSSATTNLGTVFAYSGGGRFIYVGSEPGNVDLYGADGVGTTDSAAAFASAGVYAASIKRRVYIPANTYYISSWAPPTNSVIYGEQGITIKLSVYPTWPGGSLSAQADLTKSTILIASGTTIDLNGGYIDAQYGTIAPAGGNAWDMANIYVHNADNVRILNVRLKNSFAYPFSFKYSTNIYCKDIYLTDRSGVGQITYCENVAFDGGMSLNQVFGTPVNAVQHIVDQQNNQNVSWRNFTIRNATAYAGGSYAFSGWTCGGDVGTVFDNVVFEPIGAGTAVNGAAILLDGCMDSTVEKCRFYGWNYGAATPIEIASPRNVVIRGCFIDGLKDYDDYRADGGAGIFIIDNGIWGVDTATKIYNSSNQWRARNSGANVLIEGNTIHNCFDGVLFTSSYSKMINNTITGNRNYGVLVGRPGNGGTSSFGWVGSVAHRTVGCSIVGNTIAWNGQDGIKVQKAEDLEISENRVFNNGQYGTSYDASGISNLGTVDQGQINLRDNFIGNRSSLTLTNWVSLDPSQPQWTVVSSRVTAAGSTANVVNSSTTMTASTVVNGQNVGPYVRLYLRIQSTGQTVRIVSNTTTALSLEANITAPGTGVAFDIIAVPRYLVTCGRLEEIVPGQRLTLKGVQVGGVDMTGFVELSNWGHNDEFYFRPCGSTSGTFNAFYLLGWQTTAGGAIVSGTGTFAYDGTDNYSPNGTLKLTMSGAIPATELDNPYWIGIDPGTGTVQWRRTQRSLGYGGETNQAYINSPYTQLFTGKSFLISKFNAELTLGQLNGIKFVNSPAKLNIIGTGNSFGGNTTAIVSTSSPDVPYVRLPDSTTPALPSEGDKFQLANATPRIITSITGGWEGRQVTLLYLSGSAPTFDCTGTTLVSQDGIDHTLTIGSTVTCTFSNGKWLCSFIIP